MTEKEALRYLGLNEMPNDPDIIKKAYKNLAKKVHPDAGGNEALFQLVNDTYNCLNKQTDETKQPAQKQKRPPEKKPAWSEIIRDPNFILEFKTIRNIADTKRTAHILYKNCDIHITFQDMIHCPVKAYLPLTVEVMTWPTILHKLFRRPAEKTTHQIQVSNYAMLRIEKRQSYLFGCRLSIDVDRGYHVIRFSSEQAPDMNLQITSSTYWKTQKEIPMRYSFPKSDIMKLNMLLKIKR